MNIVSFLRKLPQMKSVNGYRNWTLKKQMTYQIPPKLVKLSSDFIKGPLALIINDSFKEEIFPAKLKVGKVDSIHKGESKMQYCNTGQFLFSQSLAR